MKKPIFFTGVVMTLFCCYTARGQSIGTRTLNAAGHTATVNNYVHEWSVGESILVNTFSTSSLTVTQGVLQPVDFPLDVPSIRLDEHLQVYPNPAANNLQVKTVPGIKLMVSDITGRILLEKTATRELESIDVSQLAPGIYLVSDSNNYTAKVVKE